MIRRFLLGLVLGLLGSSPPLLAGAPPRYAVDGHEKPIALLASGREAYLVTERSVFQLQGKQFVRRYQSEAPIQCALRADSVLWLGTRQGLLRLNTGQLRARPLPLPGPAAPSVTALFQDPTGTVWVGAEGHGAFRFLNGAFQKELSIPSINAGTATPDSSVWIGTNIGLNRWHRRQWVRYNEEGVANLEIPDNIVEKLLPDNRGNLWVIMSEGISVFEGQAQQAAGHSHLPTVRFLGQPGNEVYGVAYVSGAGHLFATAMGLLLLPDEPTGHFENFEASTDKVEQKQLLVPVPALSARAGQVLSAGPPRLLQVDAKQRVWLVSAGEVVVWSPKALRRFLRPEDAAKARRPGLPE